jgi:tetratricopeptide (TPR) repeat protein
LKKYLYRVPLLFCFLIAIAFSFKNLREPDLWWQIRTGEWILENRSVPKQDMFSYTYTGTPWINIKWSAEVLSALAARIAGPESIFLMQAIIACFILFFLIKAAKQLSAKQPETAGDIALVLALLCTLFGIEYRMIGRPEMFTHFFTAVFLYLLLRHRRNPSYRILILAPLQMIWANIHEAFAIGVIITAIFCAGGWMEYYISKRKKLFVKTTQPKELTAALVAVIASVAINPNGIKLLTRPFDIMGQVYQNKFTTELADFHAYGFWQWNTYLCIAMLLTGIIGTVVYFRSIKTKSSRFILFIGHFGIGYLLALLAFFYLAATAYRNIAFLALVFSPVLVFGLHALYNKAPLFQKYYTQALIVICVLQLGIYGLIVSNKYYGLTGRHDRYGLEMLSAYNPVGAADYIRKEHLTGKCFSDYLTSSYLLWRLAPDFKTYIDLRDLDVFPPEFFFTFAEAVNDPDAFRKQDSIYHFDYIVLYRPQFEALHYYLFNDSRFKLAFLDPVAAVYIPKTNGDSSVIQFSKPRPVKASALCYGISKLFNPFYTPFNYSEIDDDALASSYCLTIGKLGEAEKYARLSSIGNIENYKGLKLLGDIYYQKTRAAQNADTKARLLDTAMGYFQQSISLNSDYADGYLGEGAVYFEQSNMVKALECFEKCISLDKGNLTAYLSAAGCCNYYINSNSPEADSYAHRAIGFYRKANGLNPDNPSIMLNLGFLYARINDCDNVGKYLGKIADYRGLTDRQRGQVRQCLNRCGK